MGRRQPCKGWPFPEPGEQHTAGMDPSLLGILAAMIGSGLFLVLRLLTRGTNSPNEPEGATVFSGDEATCLQAIDHLADAGVAAWLETTDDQFEVHVDAAVADEVPELLRFAAEAKDPEPEPGPGPGDPGLAGDA